MAGNDSNRDTRFRLWLGIAAVGIGSFIAGDASHRLNVALDAVIAWWPWALLGLAAVNLLRSLIQPESLYGPALPAAIGLLGIGIAHAVAGSTALDVLFPAACVRLGGLLLLSVGARDRQRMTRILTTGWAQGPKEILDDTTLHMRAIAGELHVDLRPSLLEADLQAEITAICGHVSIDIPRNWTVTTDPPGMLLTRIVDNGPRHEQDEDYRLNVRILGFCGAVTINRHLSTLSQN